MIGGCGVVHTDVARVQVLKYVNGEGNDLD